ncbi:MULTISPECIES: replication protein RepA [Nitrospirillum]|uniref:RepA protein n=1 Tax=Nitrospirillum amazonense TaxID=28077 RepID=A0A560GVH6_9PROT|nr:MULTISPECIES: replication protein RepA [Nitrospirillum]MDZ5646907.1 replication protein RepA [Nitrospirillum sp. BR 11828]MEE3626333.1 replication protein RepA [Nitrospirillum sp. BR 11752]TWB38033.1 RepA protein [Nitrospirillum amazonense]
MADIHRLILEHGIDRAREMATSKSGRNLVDVAAAMLAQEEDSMGITHAGFALTSLPHRSIDKAAEPEYHRKETGRCTLIVQSGRHADGSLVGVPYGAKARMILLYLQTEALKTNSRQVELGKSWHSWLKAMGESPGGKTYRLVMEQAQRITACSLQFLWETDAAVTRQNAGFVNNSILFKASPDQRQVALFQDVIELNESFYDSLKQHAVPVSEAALRHISASSTAIDVYIWLAYRLHVLNQATPVRWAALRRQFGEHYAKLSHFKPVFLDALALATAVYPEAKVEIADDGIVLHPSRPPIARREAALIA